jgi:hypothetical protein
MNPMQPDATPKGVSDDELVAILGITSDEAKELAKKVDAKSSGDALRLVRPLLTPAVLRRDKPNDATVCEMYDILATFQSPVSGKADAAYMMLVIYKATTLLDVLGSHRLMQHLDRCLLAMAMTAIIKPPQKGA